jgi:hypothetical protein
VVSHHPASGLVSALTSTATVSPMARAVSSTAAVKASA